MDVTPSATSSSALVTVSPTVQRHSSRAWPRQCRIWWLGCEKEDTLWLPGDVHHHFPSLARHSSFCLVPTPLAASTVEKGLGPVPTGRRLHCVSQAPWGHKDTCGDSRSTDPFRLLRCQMVSILRLPVPPCVHPPACLAVLKPQSFRKFGNSRNIRSVWGAWGRSHSRH